MPKPLPPEVTISGPPAGSNTEYEFGVYAANAEGVGVSEIVEFTTLLPPQQGGELRAKLPGKYTATTKDSNGDPVTFSVTIATGVNEATE